MLGKDETPAETAPPDSVRRMMRLGTLFRFQAIVEGMSNTKPVEPLTNDEMSAFEASLARDGMNEWPSWGQGNSADAETRSSERAIETRVSDYIGVMPFMSSTNRML